MKSQVASLIVLRIFFVFFNFDFCGPTWHHEQSLWSWIWFSRYHELYFFASVLINFSIQSTKHGCFLTLSSNVDYFRGSYMVAKLPKLHMWLWYGCHERFMVVNAEYY